MGGTDGFHLNGGALLERISRRWSAQRPRRWMPSVCVPLLLLFCYSCQPNYLDAGALGPLLQHPPGAAATDTELVTRAIFDSIEGRIGHHGASVVAFENGDMLAAWYSYTGPDELDGAAIFTARLDDGETEWSTPRMITGLPDRSANPLLFVDGDRVHLLFANAPHLWWSATLMQCDSQDRGETWSAPREVGAGLGGNVRNPPIQMADGSWLLPGYSDFWLHGFLLASSDGVCWSRVATFSGDGEDYLLQPAVARRDGRDALLMIARNRGGNRMYTAASDDAGMTWTRPVASEFPNPDSAAALARLADGSLLMAYNDSSTDRTPLVLVRSTDGGVTWGGRRVIAEGAGSFSYPTIVQTPDARVHVFCSENRDRIVWVELGL